MPDIYVAKKSESKKPVKKMVKRKVKKPETVADELISQRTTNPLASLAIRPKKLSFDTQEKKEKIILLARRHLMTNFKWVLITFVMLLLPRIILRFFAQTIGSFPYRSVAVLAWYLATLSYAFQNFLKWFFDVNIITDERVVDIDFPTLLYRDISSGKIDTIQDISAKTGGFIRSLFNYGDVHIQTAAEQKEFIFEAVPHPEEIIKILNQLIMEEEQEKIDRRVR